MSLEAKEGTTFSLEPWRNRPLLESIKLLSWRRSSFERVEAMQRAGIACAWLESSINKATDGTQMKHRFSSADL